MTTKWLTALLLALGAGLAIAAAWHDRDMAVDDAYITFRYAENLLAGHGLRWNPDSPPCEGYTNLGYVVGVALLRACGLAPTHAALVLASLAIAVVVWLSWRAATRAGSLAAVALAPTVLLLAAPELVVHASRGLETVAFAALAAAQLVAIARLLAPEPPRRRHAVLAATIACLLFLTRPDGVLMSLVAWVVAGWLARRDPARRRLLALAIALWLLGGATYAAAKLWWFGYLLPNPFYMKAAVVGFAGIPETLAFLRDHALLLLLATAAIVGQRLVARTHPAAADAAPSLALAITIPWLLYGSKIVHEIGFAHRFAWPLAPLLALGATRALAALAAPFAARTGPLAAVLAWCVFGGVLGLRLEPFARQWHHLGEPRPQDPCTAAFLRLGTAVRDSGIGPHLTLFCANAGATPYAAGVHHVDPAGLVDDGYCLRTPAAERGRYQAGLQFDVVAWNLFPASPLARSFDDDPRALGSEYLARFWRMDDDLDGATRHAAARQTVEQRKAELFLPMYVLREHATLIGEMRIGAPQSRLFVYVWKSSRWHDRLVAHLRQHVEIAPDAIDFVGSRR